MRSGLRNNILTVFFFVFSVTLFAQNKTEKKQLRKILREAQVHFFEENYYKAWSLYRGALRIDKKNELAGVNGAICIYKLKYPVDSALNLVQILSNAKANDAKFYLAWIKHQQKLFDEAIKLLEVYNQFSENKRVNDSDETNYQIAICNNAKIFTGHPLRSIIKNIGPGVNSIYQDYVPVMMPDESALYFTSRRDGSTGDKKDDLNNFFEDVYVSYKQDNQYRQAKNVGGPINSETNDACVAISPDGQRMIIYRTSNDQLSGDLYISKLGAKNTWSDPEKIANEINSPSIETSACFSNDTSEIYFSSDRAGGFGGKDIYRIKKKPDGTWAVPFNLGATINTTRDDDAPFLHPDGVTLFFSSRGHNTMGGFDVFKSVLDPSTNQFSDAENLGYPINDVGDDIFFVLSADGQRGYYSSIKKETYGGNDIYQIDTRYGENDIAVKHGKAFIDEVPSRVKITLMDKENQELNGNYYSDVKTGKFILVMNPLKTYQAIIESEGSETKIVDLKPIALEKNNQDLEFKIEKK
jgi:tetratricopeptide (TPR) repeat protein